MIISKVPVGVSLSASINLISVTQAGAYFSFYSWSTAYFRLYFVTLMMASFIDWTASGADTDTRIQENVLNTIFSNN